jgi:hypothetical protein
MAAPVAPAASADANPNAETAEKKRRGRPKKDKSVTISSNDDEDALIEKMMADVASMQKDEPGIAYPAEAVAATVIADVVIADPATDDDETEDEASPCSPIQTFTGPLMRCEETTPVADSMSPVVQLSSPSSFQTFEIEVEVPAPKANVTKATKAKATAAKEPKVKATKEPKVKAAKEPKAPKAKAAKEPAAKKSAKVAAPVAPAQEVVAPLASFATIPTQSDFRPRPENQETNGRIYLMAMVPTTSFTYSGKTYLRTETDNVYDNMTFELVGVWDHSNHEIIAAFDDEEDEELYFSDEE